MSSARPADGVRLRTATTAELGAHELEAIRALMHAAFDRGDDRFSDEDWAHALGGRHFLLEDDDGLVGHASVVERELRIGAQPLRTGFVEAVAVEPARHGNGLGSVLMEAVDAYIVAGFELGALGTGRHTFYQRLGWRTWLGPSSVRAPDGDQPTPDEDGDILVLETPSTPSPLDLTLPISCDPRPGDAW